MTAAARCPVLVALAGLPGVGKTTVAQRLARVSGAVCLRIDAIETSLRRRDPTRDLGPEGYHVAAELAVSNLRLGADVIVDSVNPVPLTRAIHAGAARRAGAWHLGVELACADQELHRARVETRRADLPGQSLPDWSAVMARDYQPWQSAALRLDTSRVSAEATADRIWSAMRAGPDPSLRRR